MDAALAERELHLPGEDAGCGGQSGQRDTAVHIRCGRHSAPARAAGGLLVLRMAQVGCHRGRCWASAAAGAKQRVLRKAQKDGTGALLACKA
jgi:hypothetical protein